MVETLTGKTTVRVANEGDLNAIVAMGGRFIHSTTYSGKIADNPEHRAKTALHLMESQNSIVFVAETPEMELVGFIAMCVYDHPMSGEFMASEVAWWVEPHVRGGRAGLLLMSFGEQWARSRRAKIIQMGAPTPDVCRIYEKRGYVSTERIYQKELLYA